MKGFGLCALDYPTLERLYLPLSICFYASLYYGPLFFPSLFLCSLSVVSLLCILTVILNGLIEILHQVDWILFAQRLQSIWTIALLLLFVTDRIKPDHALGRPSVVSPASESNSLQNTHIQNFYGSHDEFSLICCAHTFPPPHTLCSPSTQRSVRRRRLPFAVFPVQLCPLSFFPLPRTLRSFKLFIPVLLRQRFLRAPVVVPPSTSSRFLYLIIWAVVLLVIDAYVPYPIRSFKLSFSTAALFTPRSLRASLPPPVPPAWSGFVSLIASLVDCVFHVSDLDAS